MTYRLVVFSTATSEDSRRDYQIVIVVEVNIHFPCFTLCLDPLCGLVV